MVEERRKRRRRRGIICDQNGSGCGVRWSGVARVEDGEEANRFICESLSIAGLAANCERRDFSHLYWPVAQRPIACTSFICASEIFLLSPPPPPPDILLKAK
jgi:hypothetical protein